jgi:lycopene cyclase CruP
VDWDVVICGGTLGILVGVALVRRGWRVAVLERGLLRGREQEWNISRHELQQLVHLDLLTPEELDGAIASVYNPGRISFREGHDIWIRDVLNVGVSPVRLLDTLKHHFLQAGGTLCEQVAFERAIAHPNGVEIQTTRLSGESVTFTTRLMLDVMGHFSPVARQARQGQPPDAICLVVGTCAQGFPQNDTGDLFVSFTPAQKQCQYFWEAFPAQDGRTTYLFTYLDAHPKRPSLEELFDDYFALLPSYQQVELEKLAFKRAVFGFFPCYQDSPLRSPWSRMLAVGDSSGSQSPLSFGGFGALIRHLPRLIQGIHEALEEDLLDAASLGLLQPYQPNLSVTWLFQRTMSIRMGQTVPPEQINQVLTAVFQEMAALGDPVLRPFLQDVVQFPALAQAMLRTGLLHPITIGRILPQVGLRTLVDWMGHYGNLARYTALFQIGRAIAPYLEPTLKSRQRYYVHRWLETWQYGSGLDYQPASTGDSSDGD